MLRSSPCLSGALAAALAVWGSPASAQSIEGRVALSGWDEPLGSARVQLLDVDLATLSVVETDSDGRYVFTDLEPGVYYVQAVREEVFSSVAGPMELDRGDPPVQADLTVRSRLHDRAVACLGPDPDDRRSVLAGIAFDASTDTPLPGARVRVRWEGETTGSRESLTDGGGRFVVCGLPPAVPLSVWMEALGRSSPRMEGVLLKSRTLARLDIPVELGQGGSVRILEALSEPLRPDRAATLEGRLLDAETGSPIPAAVVTLAGGDDQEVTDARGRFRLTNVPPGDHIFEVRRLGYDWESGPITVPVAATMLLELRAAPSAIGLEAVVVRVSTPETRMARGLTQAPRVIAGADLLMAEQRTAPLADVIREFPNLSIREGRFETSDGIEVGICVESSRAMHRLAVPERRTSLPWCEMIAIVVDGVPTVRGGEAVHMIRVGEIESIEFLPPIGAIRWGERAAINGALVLWTRGRGPHRDPNRAIRP